MSKFLVILLFLIANTCFNKVHNVLGEDKFNLTKYDYCKIKCIAIVNRRRHIACECETRYPEHIEKVEDWFNFRTKITGIHNWLRNVVAEAKKKTMLPPASNMFYMNYDLELEYIVRCFARHYYLMTRYNDVECLKTHDNITVGMVEFKNQNQDDIDDWFLMGLEHVKEDSVISYDPRDQEIQPLLLAIWWSVDRLGCTKIKNPSFAMKHLIICFYRGANGSGLIKGEPVYIQGDACSNCPSHLPCKGTLKLCGELKPIPKDELNLLPFTSNRSRAEDENDDLNKTAKGANHKSNGNKGKHSFVLVMFLFAVSLIIQWKI